LLGTGTSQGVPVIGCTCEVCHSADIRDKRLRTSALIRIGNTHIAIDTGPDFRQQMLRTNTTKLDAVLFTHEHNDHIIGLDDVRTFNFMSRSPMQVYATEQVEAELRQRFAYVFAKNRYPGAPRVEIKRISKDIPFTVEGVQIIPIEVMHGKMPVLGFRFGDFAYITDMKTISREELKKLEGLSVLVLNTLHRREHHSHINLQQALELILKINPKQVWLTHISHTMGLHAEVEKELPENVRLGYDGLKIRI